MPGSSRSPATPSRGHCARRRTRRPPTCTAWTGRPRTCSGRRSSGPGTSAIERLTAYLTKAAREAKQHTAWVDGDADYERRLVGLVDAAMQPGQLRALVDTALAHNREAVRTLVLGQKLLQLTVPGAAGQLPGLRGREPLAGRPGQPSRGGLRGAAGPARRRLRAVRHAPGTSTTRSCCSPTGRSRCARTCGTASATAAPTTRCPRPPGTWSASPAARRWPCW